MIKIDYSFNNKKLFLETETQISGPKNLLRIELGMILFYLIENKQINKNSIDDLVDIVNDAVNAGVTNNEMLKMFLNAAFGLTFKE